MVHSPAQIVSNVLPVARYGFSVSCHAVFQIRHSDKRLTAQVKGRLPSVPEGIGESLALISFSYVHTFTIPTYQAGGKPPSGFFRGRPGGGTLRIASKTSGAYTASRVSGFADISNMRFFTAPGSIPKISAISLIVNPSNFTFLLSVKNFLRKIYFFDIFVLT
jgi:hypothetical protein